jgi:hypothetical protein
MREHKLENSVNQQGELKQKGVTQMGLKEGLGVFRKLQQFYTNTELSVLNSLKISEQD